MRVPGVLPTGKPAWYRGVLWEVDVTSFLLRMTADESGATAIEYALIASGIAVAIVGGVSMLSDSVRENFEMVAQWLGN